jgi:hypothetical protein
MGNDPILPVSQTSVQTTTLITPLRSLLGKQQDSLFLYTKKIKFAERILKLELRDGLEPP